MNTLTCAHKCLVHTVDINLYIAPYSYRPLLFVVLWFAFSIIHRSGRAVKNGEGLGTPRNKTLHVRSYSVVIVIFLTNYFHTALWS